jgi:hypothetical protein
VKTLGTVILAVLIFLAVSSGITKVLLMRQDVEFFGKYGLVQLLVGVQKTSISRGCHRGDYLSDFSGGPTDGRQFTGKHRHRCCNTIVGCGHEAKLAGRCSKTVRPIPMH